MNLEKLVAKRANARLDAITPNPYKKQPSFPLWAKIAIPSALTVLIVAVPLIISFSSRTASTSYGPEPGGHQPETTTMEPDQGELIIEGKRYVQETSLSNLPRCIGGKSIEEIKGERIGEVTEDINVYLAKLGGFELCRIKGSSSQAALMATDGTTVYYYLYVPSIEGNNEMDGTPKQPRLFATLEYNGIFGGYSIEAYGMGRSSDGVYSYIEPVYEFHGNDAEAIIASIDALNNDYFGYYERLAGPDTKRNPEGDLMGVSYRLVVTDGIDVFPLSYVSQFHTVSFWNVRVDISGSDAFTIMDEQMEMDYDENDDPLRN